MGAHHHEVVSVEEQFEFTSNAKRKLLIGMGIGVALILIGSYLLANGAGHDAHDAAHAAAGHGADHAHDDHGHGYHWTQRIIANLWLNSVYFAGIAVIGMFFISYNYLAQAGWSAIFKRIPEAMPAFLPIPAVIMIVLAVVFGDKIYHWMHEGVMDPTSAHYDAIIAGKQGFLNKPFYFIRLVLYFVLWYGLWKVIRNLSLQEDEIGGLDSYEKSIKYGTAFLVIFAITSSTASWDFVMSIDTHWFSTMFGWYTLASWHVAGLATMTLAIVTLREMGYLKGVNESHLHDLGKFCFAFTIFWTYVWFAQFLLIYYANIPEEAYYYRERFSGYGGIYKTPFFINILLNFVTPFLVLMTRDSKRSPLILKIACWSIIVGHYFDFYNNIMPGTVGANGGFGALEFGFVLLFACGFIWMFSSQLTQANLIPRNHPMLEESLHHDIA
ncbi:MAG: quinol:cytochrome C oxidoreductase [Runella sp.]